MKKQIASFFILFLLSSVSFAGGGWPQPKKSGYIKLNQYIIVADEYYTPAGDIVSIRTNSVFISSLYAEYGFTDRLTGILYFPFFTRTTLNEEVKADGTILDKGDELNSVGDTEIAIKYGLIVNKPLVVSASLTLGLPFGDESGGRTRLLQTGDGEFNQMLSVDVSRSFNQLYVSSLVGLNNRTEGFSDEFRYGFEVGLNVEKFTFILRLAGIESLNNGDDEITNTNGIFNNNIEYLSYTPEVIYNFTKKAGMSLSFGGAFYGKQVLADPSYSAGVFMKF